MALNEEINAQGVHFLGDFEGNCGISRAGRDLIEVVRSLCVPIELLELPLSPERNAELAGTSVSDRDFAAPRSRLSIAHCNADTLAYVARRLPQSLFEDRRIVGVWYWEAQNLPESHRHGFDWVDEVWVTSRFIAENLSRYSPVPVRHFPPLMKLAEPPARLDLPPELANDRFVFLFCFDYRSQPARKNPEGVCEAFVRAFPQPLPDGPLCVIKSFGGRKSYTLDHLELRLRYRRRPDILFLDEWFTESQRDSLMSRADCYVSLHRAEGLGLTLLESMALGKPCIATAYSGNVDFMSPENSWLIPAKLQPVGPGIAPFLPNDLWADPDLNCAARAMNEVFENRDEAVRRGNLGRETVRTRHSIEAVGARVAVLLEGSLRSPARSKPIPASEGALLKGVSARARAFECLKESRRVMEEISKLGEPGILGRDAARRIRVLSETLRIQQRALSETLKEVGEIRQSLKQLEMKSKELLQLDPSRLLKIIDRLVDET